MAQQLRPLVVLVVSLRSRDHAGGKHIGAQGQQTEIEIAAQHIKATRAKLNKILADTSGQPFEKVQADTERDHYLTADEALEYGLIDRIVSSRAEAAKGTN